MNRTINYIIVDAAYTNGTLHTQIEEATPNPGTTRRIKRGTWNALANACTEAVRTTADYTPGTLFKTIGALAEEDTQKHGVALALAGAETNDNGKVVLTIAVQEVKNDR